MSTPLLRPSARSGSTRPRTLATLALATVALATVALSTVALSTSPAHAQRTVVGAALGYELEGAVIPESDLETLPARVAEALTACSTDAVPLAGRALRARLAVAPNGRVTTATLEGEGAEGAPAAARGCVERALATLRFPARARATTLVLDLELRERSAGSASATVDPATRAYRESVVHAMERHQPAVHACFERSRRAHESPDRRVLVELTIAADGHVRAQIPSATLMPQLAECLTREIQGWTLPRPPTAPFPMDHRFEGLIAAYE